MRFALSFVVGLFFLAAVHASSSDAFKSLAVKQGLAMAPNSAADECGGSDWGNSGDFDFYVFAQSWSAEFCYSHTSYPGCKSPTSYMQTQLTIHGLWPNYQVAESGHEWPQCCTDTPYGFALTQATVTALYSNLSVYWPNEQDPTGKDLVDSLWYHEWQVHGTCSGLTQINYFTQGMNVHLKTPTPTIIRNNIGKTINRSDLYAAYGAGSCTQGGACKVGFTCQAGQYLDGVLTCWSKQYQQITCPAATVGDWSCSSSTIQITSF